MYWCLSNLNVYDSQLIAMESLATLVTLAVWFWKKNDFAETMKSNSTRRVLRGEGAGRFKGTTSGVGIVTAWGPKFFLLGLWIVNSDFCDQCIHSQSFNHSIKDFEFNEFWFEMVKRLWCSFDNAYVGNGIFPRTSQIFKWVSHCATRLGFLEGLERRCFWSRVSSQIRYPKVNCPWAHCS